jgi:hypothetical protein
LACPNPRDLLLDQLLQFLDLASEPIKPLFDLRQFAAGASIGALALRTGRPLAVISRT